MTHPERGRQELLEEVASRLADATPVPWEELAAANPELAPRLERLRLLESISRAFAVHETDDRDPPEEPLFRWGSLDVVELLGAGSFGQVFRAHDRVLGRNVALKLRHDASGTRAASGRRFLEEARRLARVRHPNVVTIHGADVRDGRIGLWVDLVEGDTLEDVLNDRGPLPPDEAAAIGVELCRALGAVHAAGVVHGDVKATNVMRDSEGRVILMDFGAAEESGGPAGARLVRGTPLAVAPELLDGEPPSPASDVYSLGVLLYRLLSGRYPVEAGELTEVRRLHREGMAIRLRSRRRGLPRGLVAAVDRALAPDPRQRFADAAALEEALLPFTPSPAGGERRRGRSFGSRKLAGAAMAVALLLGGFAAWSRLERSENAPPPRSVPMSTFPGSHSAVSFSPSGDRFVFVDEAEGVPQLWIDSSSRGVPRQLTFGEIAASRPRWTSTDRIVYGRSGEGIWSLPARGGEPRQLFPVGIEPDASPAGDRVVFQHERSLWMGDVRSGAYEPLEGAPQWTFSQVRATPAFSPDGREIAFFLQETGPLGDFWVISSSGGSPRRLTHDVAEGGGVAWLPDGSALVVSSGRGGSRNLWTVPLDETEPRPLTTGAGEDLEPAVHPGGDRIAYTNRRTRWLLTRLDPETGEIEDLHESRSDLWLPEVSPDGRRLAWFGSNGFGYHVFTLGLPGRRSRQVTREPGRLHIHPRWSPDGSSLYYYLEGGGEEGLRRIDLRDGSDELVVPGWTWLRQMDARPDPAERHLLYIDMTGEQDATILWSLEGDPPRTLLVGEEHTHANRWSPDGARFAGYDHEGQVVVCVLEPLACRQLTPGTRPVWTPDGEALLFHRPHPERGWWELWEIDLASGREHLVEEVGPSHSLSANASVGPDGNLFFSRWFRGQSELWMLHLAGG